MINYINEESLPNEVEDFSYLNKLSPEIAEVILRISTKFCPNWYPNVDKIAMSPDLYANKIIPAAWRIVDRNDREVEFLFWGDKKFYR
ncbi:hypothetical protein FBY58_1162 [Zymomonas mobilis]|uniref:Uncharacterized protein n=1 Tax=Zymomonas mobilis TaxID=542 RepID=A0A542W1U9_ZYMMB|nr:hypothetical protein [Zymomonas mobilis]TQL17570.1 hypothetical protein FBY58_1162 [Zymomonas mobilis]